MHNLLGEKRGKLTILKKAENIGSKTAWVALCDCGNEKVVKTHHFLRKDNKATRSCGCSAFKKGEESSRWKGEGGISSTYWSRTKQSAKSRSILFDIDIKEASDKFKEQNGMCSLSGQKLILNVDASLDRIDSKGGYTVDNIQWIHKDINRIKSDLDQDYFLNICHLISKHHEVKYGMDSIQA